MSTQLAQDERLFAEALARPEEERAAYIDAMVAAREETPVSTLDMTPWFKYQANRAFAQCLVALATLRQGRVDEARDEGSTALGVNRELPKNESAARNVAQTRPLTSASTYSFGMPHSPAAMSRRFISRVMGTAPIDFSQRRQPANVVGASFTASGGTRRILCLIREVFLACFEVVDGILQCFVETQVAQPEFFAQISSGGEEVLVGNAVGRVKAGKNAIAIVRARHQSHNKGNHLALNRGEIHRDVAGPLEPDDERFVAHGSTRIRTVTDDPSIPRVGGTEIGVCNGRFAP